MDARGNAHSKQSVLGTFGIYYYSLLSIKSANKAITPAEVSVYTHLVLCQSLITVVSERANTTTVFIPHTHSAYGINQTVKKDTVVLPVLTWDVVEGCNPMKCHFHRFDFSEFKKLGNIINYGPNSHFQSKPIFRIILKYLITHLLKATLVKLHSNLGDGGATGNVPPPHHHQVRD
jgi:hypothetical protein